MCCRFEGLSFGSSRGKAQGSSARVKMDTTREKTKENGKGREIPEELGKNRIQNIMHGKDNDK